ncbi:uncharacterized protein CIMG_09297 [Coccidioides immitis RS]|uniref:Uncharacterized protein n=1 Tax=Coccidioides immitis (strain RS) TaxID=246410 RepID=A0A0E1RUN5_COCIM|nr:uncharacterized protein CIMG_09297 [Coccidioides immitis RS]EAS28093.2 hypothetical protein CIMG_09297 [Coccidioides immitis RS]
MKPVESRWILQEFPHQMRSQRPFPWTFQNLFRITDSGISAVRSRKREFKVLCRSAAEEYKSNLRRRQSKKFSFLDTAVESLVGMDVDDPRDSATPEAGRIHSTE